MRKIYIVFLAVLFLSMIPTPFNHSVGLEVHAQDQLYAVRVLNTTTAYINQPVAIYNIIVNPETWVLHNITFAFSIAPTEKATVSDIAIVDMINASGVTTEIAYGTESILVRVFIENISMNTTFIHWIVVKFKVADNYSIITEEPISLVRTKGELKEEITDLGINDASIEVKEKPKPYPKEGTKDSTILVAIITIIAPLAIIVLSNKLLRVGK